MPINNVSSIDRKTTLAMNSSTHAERSSAYQANSLCYVCQQYVQKCSLLYKTSKDIETQERHDHHTSMEQLEISAQNGCHLCNLLCCALESSPTQEQRLETPCRGSALQLIAYYGESLKGRIKADMQRGTRDYFSWLQCELCINLHRPDGCIDRSASLAVCRTKHTAFDRKFHGKSDEDCNYNPPGSTMTHMLTGPCRGHLEHH
jgi:hypothetical protein